MTAAAHNTIALHPRNLTSVLAEVTSELASSAA